ncbi:sperm-associated antigen 1-like isoform X2 [Lytechinus pictus]
MVNDVVAKMEKEKTQIEDELKKKGSTSSISGQQQLSSGETKAKSGGRRLVIQEVEDEDAGEKEVNVSKKTPEEKGSDNGKQCPVESGSSEIDGGSSSNSKPPVSSSSQLLNNTSQVPIAANQSEPSPTPPEPAPPLPQMVVSLKDAGNDFFKQGQYTEANDRYSKAIKTLCKDKDVHSMGLSTLYSNRASCHHRSGNPKACIEDCTSALDLNPNNVKTYLKRAQAYETIEKYDYAYVDFKTAMNFDMYNTNAQNGASRMLPILKDKHGKQWREKLPSEPKSPSFPWPAYVHSSLGSTTTSSPSSNTTMSTNSRNQTAPGSTPVQTIHPAAKTNAAQTISPAAEVASSLPSSSTTPPAAKAPSSASTGGAAPPEGAMPSSTKTAHKPKTSPSQPPLREAGKKKTTKDKPKTKEERFQEFKAQGNDLVKKGAYSQAIGCYTRSIEVDSSQSVSYSNRALCYLKLNLPEDAIEDCNEALKRDPKGVKALYRRALARKTLGSFQESVKDLMDLLKIEPANPSAKKELELVKDAWRKDLRDKQSKAAQESKENGVENGVHMKKKSGKRMQIEEVTESSDEEQDPVSRKSNIPSSPKATSLPAAEKGGIDTGKKEKRKNLSAAATESSGTKSSNVANGLPAQKKMTAYEFMQEWTSLKRRKNVEAHAKLLKQVQPNDIPKVMSNKLDGDMLAKILSASANHLVEEDPAFTYQLLNKLRCVDRFKTIAMFLTKMDKDNMQRCINMISSKPEICKEDDLKKLKKAYQI